MGKNIFILNVAFSNKWTVWIGCTSGKTTDSSTDMGWTMYAENIHTGKILVIDRDINTIPCNFKYSPFQISISGYNIVYSIYTRTSDKSINAVIKLANLENKNVYQLDKNKNVYAMYLYNKIIFWKEHFPDEPRKVIIKYAILK